MPEPTTPTPQAGDGGAPPPQAGDTTPTTPQAGKSPEDYERMIAELRKENASHRVKLKAVEDAEAARQLAALSDAEKLQKRAEQAEKQIQTYKQELINAQVKLAAKDKGIIDPDIAALALHDKLEFGDNGMPSNLEKALDDLIKSKPYLVPQPGQQAPASAAQTADNRRAPMTPANNPGRSNIVQPGQLPPNQIMRLTDVYRRDK